MKTIRFLVPVISCGVLTFGLRAAGDPPRLPPEPGRGSGVLLAKRPGSLLNAFRPVSYFHAPTFKRAFPIAKTRLPASQTAKHDEKPARLPVAKEHVPRHTAAIGGPVAATRKTSTAALDGAAMKRKPW